MSKYCGPLDPCISQWWGSLQLPSYWFASIACLAAPAGIDDNCPLIIDSGASVCVTNNRADFITYSSIYENKIVIDVNLYLKNEK